MASNVKTSRERPVVARIGQGITLKRLRRIDDECVEVEPESTKHRSIRIDAQSPSRLHS